ncbi:PPOX class F420-dependent oxidoreductase [Kitasatospora sp. NPDC091207]|uniref:PPOX class F420-dependent oxidoreductase n=1 Tax=Kitasatospora sp. NPDC091207 TaxID=3364083 RepID=UPI003810E6B2
MTRQERWWFRPIPGGAGPHPRAEQAGPCGRTAPTRPARWTLDLKSASPSTVGAVPDATERSATVTVFTPEERAYLSGQALGRLATSGPRGAPQVRPVGFRLNEDGTIDIGGPRMAASQKYRNAARDPRVSFLVDDLTPADAPDAPAPGWGRGVEIRGRAEPLTVDVPPVSPDTFAHEILRIHPERVISWDLAARGSTARDVTG